VRRRPEAAAAAAGAAARQGGAGAGQRRGKAGEEVHARERGGVGLYTRARARRTAADGPPDTGLSRPWYGIAGAFMPRHGFAGA
jgi:hypothetical protein